MYIIDLLANDNYTIINKTIAKKIGLENAMLLGVLCSLQKTFKGKQFYRPEKQLIEDTCLTLYSLRKCKNDLIKLGILEVEKKGLPAQHYFKINEGAIKKLLDDIKTSGIENTTTSGIENTTTTYNINNNIKNNINNNIKNNNVITNNNIYIYIEQNYGRTLSPREYQMIDSWLLLYNEEIIKYAVDISILNSKKTFSYVNGILNNWKGCNYETLEDIKNSDKPKRKSAFTEALEKGIREVERMERINDNK